MPAPLIRRSINEGARFFVDLKETNTPFEAPLEIRTHRSDFAGEGGRVSLAARNEAEKQVTGRRRRTSAPSTRPVNVRWPDN
ncbi:unnamed protein product, partial [Iphiclides podalirius]